MADPETARIRSLKRQRGLVWDRLLLRARQGIAGAAQIGGKNSIAWIDSTKLWREVKR